MEHLFPYPKMGHSWLEILYDPLTRKLLGHDQVFADDALPFISGAHTRLDFLLRDPAKHLPFLKIGYTALEAFLQSNATGPPLEFDSVETIIPNFYRRDAKTTSDLMIELRQSLSVDGDAVYHLTPNIELFWLAKLCMNNTTLADEGFNGRRARFRVNFWHQKLLLEKNETMRELIFHDMDVLEGQLSSRLKFGGAAAEEHLVEFLMERSAAYTYYSEDSKAREDLLRVAQIRRFQFALTGHLGKRTKFQDRDISQLVVLAKSRDFEPEPYSSRKSSRAEGMDSRRSSRSQSGSVSGYGPENIPLNDDTLLEAINFVQMPNSDEELSEFKEREALSHTLGDLDPAHQPQLFPIDSLVLLGTASSIANTSPADGLTREETLPYAIRVLEGGSSNWQVYSQALLIRSRIEGYRSRTAERGLLQLQALVDQVVAETTHKEPCNEELQATHNSTTTFLPRLSLNESASVAERLKYIYQISPPLRWELESELAARWVSMGGLKTALEIYERLEMHAEVILCLAGTEQEAEAISRTRRLLFESTPATNGTDPRYYGEELSALPPNAPRLYCILGDLENEPKHFERAWIVSNQRYARAQRSLGRHLIRNNKPREAADALSKSLEINRLDEKTWFSLGACQLELQDWHAAVQSFTRCVQLDDAEAEAWSNLAVALLRLRINDQHDKPDTYRDGPFENGVQKMQIVDEDSAEDSDLSPQVTRSEVPKNVREALQALKRAAQLKRDDARIWDNYLTVAATIPPPDTPWSDIIIAQRRLIEIRGKSIGERAIDENILKVLVRHVIENFEYPSEESDSDIANALSRGSVPRQVLELMDDQVVPLITSSPTLWTLVSLLSRWRRRPLASLDAQEKSWRIVTGQPGIYDKDEAVFDAAVNATEWLVKFYEELDYEERERTGGKVIEGDWRFKARSAVRSVIGKARANWEDSQGMRKLQDLLETLSS